MCSLAMTRVQCYTITRTDLTRVLLYLPTRVAANVQAKTKRSTSSLFSLALLDDVLPLLSCHCGILSVVKCIIYISRAL